jgi:hypothetical protein
MIHCSLCTIYVDNVLLKGHLFSAALPDIFGETWVGVYYTDYKMHGDSLGSFCTWHLMRSPGVCSTYLLFPGMSAVPFVQ